MVVLRYFEKISDYFTQWLDGLSDRERKLLGILSIVFCVLLVLSTFYIATSKISSKKKALETYKTKLLEVRSLEGSYKRAKERNERALRNIRRNRVSLFTFIQEISTRLGLDIRNLNEQTKSLPKSKVIEVLVKINLKKLSIDKVTALIEAIESSEHGDQVKVTKLKVSKRFDNPELLDIQMTVSTWKSA